jgi:hypothetical protein
MGVVESHQKKGKIRLDISELIERRDFAKRTDSKLYVSEEEHDLLRRTLTRNLPRAVVEYWETIPVSVSDKLRGRQIENLRKSPSL